MLEFYLTCWRNFLMWGVVQSLLWINLCIYLNIIYNTWNTFSDQIPVGIKCIVHILWCLVHSCNIDIKVFFSSNKNFKHCLHYLNACVCFILFSIIKVTKRVLDTIPIVLKSWLLSFLFVVLRYKSVEATHKHKESPFTTSSP